MSHTGAALGRIAGLALGAALTLGAARAAAAPPGRWSIGVERLFGASHTWQDSDGPRSTTQTSLSLFTQRAPRIGYAATRIGVDHVLDVGLSFGGALGYGESVAEGNDDLRLKTLLFAPRLGLVLSPVPALVVWPRAGLTLTDSVRTVESNVSALTLEVPVALMIPGHVVGLTLTPYYEHGFESPGLLGTHQVLSELGASVGLNAFF